MQREKIIAAMREHIEQRAEEIAVAWTTYPRPFLVGSGQLSAYYAVLATHVRNNLLARGIACYDKTTCDGSTYIVPDFTILGDAP